MSTKPAKLFGTGTPGSAAGKPRTAQPTRYNKEKRRSQLLMASKHTEKLLSILEKEKLAMFERRSLEALTLMLNALHEAIEAYEEKERQHDSSL